MYTDFGFFSNENKNMSEILNPTEIRNFSGSFAFEGDTFEINLDDVLEVIGKEISAENSEAQCASNCTSSILAHSDPTVEKNNFRNDYTLSTINMGDLGLEPIENAPIQSSSLLLKYLTSETPVFDCKQARQRNPFFSTQQKIKSGVNTPDSVKYEDELPDLIIERPVTVTTLEYETCRPVGRRICSRRESLSTDWSNPGSRDSSCSRTAKRSSSDCNVQSPLKQLKLDLEIAKFLKNRSAISTPDVINLVLDSESETRASSDSERPDCYQPSPQRSGCSTPGSYQGMAIDSRHSTPSPTNELARRERNNAASRKSRLNRKKREEELHQQLEKKDLENKVLQRKVDVLEAEKQALKQLLNEVLTNRLSLNK